MEWKWLLSKRFNPWSDRPLILNAIDWGQLGHRPKKAREDITIQRNIQQKERCTLQQQLAKELEQVIANINRINKTTSI